MTPIPPSQRELPPLEERPVVLEFPDPEGPHAPGGALSEPSPRPAPDAGAHPGSGWLAYFFPAVLLAAACLPLLFIVRRPLGLVGWVGGAAATVALLWVVVSTLWPNRPNRTCPECGEERLRRLDPGTTVGLECGACGWSDPDESAWMLAEEEGPLEQLVLAQRGRASQSKGATPSVDKSTPTD